MRLIREWGRGFECAYDGVVCVSDTFQVMAREKKGIFSNGKIGWLERRGIHLWIPKKRKVEAEDAQFDLLRRLFACSIGEHAIKEGQK